MAKLPFPSSLQGPLEQAVEERCLCHLVAAVPWPGRAWTQGIYWEGDHRGVIQEWEVRQGREDSQYR